MSLELTAIVSKLKIDKELRETVHAIADEANDFGVVHVRVDYLAWRMDCEPRDIQKHLDKLCQIGALVQGNRGRQDAPIYRLDLSVFPRKPAFDPEGPAK